MRAAVEVVGVEDGYLVADADGRYVGRSPGLLALLGVDLETLTRCRLGDFSPPAMRADLGRLANVWLAVPGAWLAGETELMCATGRGVAARFVAVRRPNGRLLTRLDPKSDDGREPTPASVLEEWRAHERRLAELTPGTEEHLVAEMETAWLRSEYHRLVASRTDEDAHPVDERPDE